MPYLRITLSIAIALTLTSPASLLAQISMPDEQSLGMSESSDTPVFESVPEQNPPAEVSPTPTPTPEIGIREVTNTQLEVRPSSADKSETAGGSSRSSLATGELSTGRTSRLDGSQEISPAIQANQNQRLKLNTRSASLLNTSTDPLAGSASNGGNSRPGTSFSTPSTRPGPGLGNPKPGGSNSPGSLPGTTTRGATANSLLKRSTGVSTPGTIASAGRANSANNSGSLGFGSSVIRSGNKPKKNLPPPPPSVSSDKKKKEGDESEYGMKDDSDTKDKDVKEGNDYTELGEQLQNRAPKKNLPPLTNTDEQEDEDKEKEKDTNNKDLKDLITNPGNPADEGNGTVSIDDTRIAAVKKQVQKRKCEGQDSKTTGSGNCVESTQSEAQTRGQVCKKRSEIGGKCEEWGPAPSGPVVDYNRAQPDNVVND